MKLLNALKGSPYLCSMKNCHCGREKAYEDCCGAIISGKKKALIAEDLMRSRYSAHVEVETDYIVNTFAMETRPVNEREEIKAWASETQWEYLEVISTKDGLETDSTGYVEFKAWFREQGKPDFIHENSFFRKENDHWYYVSGEVPKALPVISNKTVGRNDPCPCGSGKKYKKCCMK